MMDNGLWPQSIIWSNSTYDYDTSIARCTDLSSGLEVCVDAALDTQAISYERAIYF